MKLGKNEIRLLKSGDNRFTTMFRTAERLAAKGLIHITKWQVHNHSDWSSCQVYKVELTPMGEQVRLSLMDSKETSAWQLVDRDDLPKGDD